MDDLTFDTSRCFIANEWLAPSAKQYLSLTNPSDGNAMCDIARCDVSDISRAIEAAVSAISGEWGRATAAERGRFLFKLHALVLDNIDLLTRLEAMDVGKPVKQAHADVLALARYLEFYGGACDKFHGETIPYLDGYTVYTLREPHGITGHIIPWNYPMQIIGRSVGAALAAGNAVVLKPAEEACLTALMFADLAKQAGLPSGALSVVPGIGAEAGASICDHPSIDHISFTGSVPTGQIIQSAAAKNIVPVTLELGGKSPQLVFDDADVDAAMPYLVNAGIQNAGQTCSASSRILVQRGVYDEVVDRMTKRYNELVAGPALGDYDLGPVISLTQKNQIDGFLSEADGLNLVAEGRIVNDAPSGGFYVRPRLYADVPTHHTLAQDEVFGPVQAIIPFVDEDDALNIANGTKFGLVASIWSRDGGRQMRLAKRLRCGQVFINNYGAGGGVELPFGGVGLSGHGREKGFEALYGFTKLKTVAAWHG